MLEEVLRGPSAIVYGGDGPIPIAKVLREWKRKFKPLRVKGGVAEGEVLAAGEVDGLADLPDMPQMRGMLLSTVLGPARGIAGSLQAVYGGIARALQARIDQEWRCGRRERRGRRWRIWWSVAHERHESSGRGNRSLIMSEQAEQTIQLDEELEGIFSHAGRPDHREGGQAREGSRGSLGRLRRSAGRHGGRRPPPQRRTRRRRRPPSTSS